MRVSSNCGMFVQIFPDTLFLDNELNPVINPTQNMETIVPPPVPYYITMEKRSRIIFTPLRLLINLSLSFAKDIVNSYSYLHKDKEGLSNVLTVALDVTIKINVDTIDDLVGPWSPESDDITYFESDTR